MCFIQFSMAHWKKRGIFMVENQVFGRAAGGGYMDAEITYIDQEIL